MGPLFIPSIKKLAMFVLPFVANITSLRHLTCTVSLNESDVSLKYDDTVADARNKKLVRKLLKKSKRQVVTENVGREVEASARRNLTRHS